MSVLVLNVVIYHRTKTPGPGAQSALRALARSGMKIGRIGENTIAVWTDYLLSLLYIWSTTSKWISALDLMQQLLWNLHLLLPPPCNQLVKYFFPPFLWFRGRHSNSIRFNPKEGWTSRSPSVKLHQIFSANKKRNQVLCTSVCNSVHLAVYSELY